MFFRRSKDKELKMIWEIEKGDKRSSLVGTAHFFPYSFRSSLEIHIGRADIVLLEGPLDEENMTKVRKAGSSKQDAPHLFDELDKRTIARITQELFPGCKSRNLYLFFDPRTCREENPAYDMIRGMEPWMAFFTLWTHFLEIKGWKYSVDYEAYTIAREMGKDIVFLEKIDEQINVLETLSRERIIAFLKLVDRWNDYTSTYVRGYLAGDLDKLKFFSIGFPSRHYPGIKKRDQILYDRMRPYLHKGRAIVFVGAPHVWGISEMLSRNGYLKKPLRKG